jgi:anaerobic magnesium-protoporphyrin IX monomethyl ester cyclase
MKILLIYPYFLDKRIHEYDISVPPIGIYYVGALLKENGYDVHIYNWHNANHTPDIISDTINKERPDIIGFSILHANRWGGIDIAKIAKNLNPDIKIVFGGIGATFLWEHLLTHFHDIDYIVLGEGEIPFLQLVKALEEDAHDKIPHIPGIAFRHQQQPQKTNPAAPVENLDQFPNPARYFQFQHVAFTRGCPGNCAFCGSPLFWGPRVRTHSPGYFVDQLELLTQKGISFFYFSDDTFTYKQSWVKAICQEIIHRQLHITWVTIARVNHIQADILGLMRKAGCIQISFGIESGSEKIRQKLNKPIKTAQIKKTFDLVKHYGIMPRAYFIYGSPGESEETIQASIDLIRTIKPLSIITYILDIFPGTRIYQELLEQGCITEDIWQKRIEDLLYFEIDDRMDPQSILTYGNALRHAFYQNLPLFVEDIDLIKDPGFNRLHADFYSRLGMTFSHGDYSKIDAIPGKKSISEALFQKSLACYPDHRSYLGLGMLYQQERAFEKSIRILDQGLIHFDSNMDLRVCQGINYMNLKDFDRALTYFLDYKDQEHVGPHINKCYKAMGESEKKRNYNQNR